MKRKVFLLLLVLCTAGKVLAENKDIAVFQSDIERFWALPIVLCLIPIVLLYFSADFRTRVLSRILLAIASMIVFFVSYPESSVLYSLVRAVAVTLPGFLVSIFVFQKREEVNERKKELKKLGYYPDSPFFKPENGTMVFLSPDGGNEELCKNNRFVRHLTKEFTRVIPQPYTSICLQAEPGGERLVFKKDKVGLVDKSGEIIIPIECEDLKLPFSEGLCAFRENGKWGFLEMYGRVVIEPRFDAVIEPFKNGKALVENFQETFFIDRSGKTVFDVVN